ncbi:MAG: restriction endonuclease subunit S [Dolichospermum sp.]
MRFKDDDGCNFPDWEKKKLKDIFTIKYGKDYKHLNSGNIPVIGTGGIMTYVDQFLYDKPSVLIGRKGTIDKPQFIEKPFWTVDTLFYTEINKGFCPFFVYLLALQINWYKFNEATGVPSLNTTAINNIDVFVPSSFQEQTKIANFLTTIDEKISQTQTYLETVKQYKQGLLQQMFI